LHFVEILLALAAAYSAGMWLWLAGLSVTKRHLYTPDQLVEVEHQTFHLGLCFILSLGFLLVGGR